MSADPYDIYLRDLRNKLNTGDTSEHTFRSCLENLIKSMQSGLEVINEPKWIKCGAPDLKVLSKKGKINLGIGYIEAKDIDAELKSEERSEQLKRYRKGIHNLILTNYIEFIWFIDGDKRKQATLAEYDTGTRLLKKRSADDVRQINELLEGFLAEEPVEVGSAKELAQRMAQLTRMLHDSIIEAFEQGEASADLKGWRMALAEALIPDLDRQEKTGEFADLFAQTLAYGLFTARVEDVTPQDFNLDEAKKLIPETNPFLQEFFYEITRPKMDKEPFYGYVQDLENLLANTSMDRVLADFGKRKREEDPVLHFYETFLAAYDPKERERRGVYYTPDAVVSFIVRSVDYLLRTRFGCYEGLADNSEVTYPKMVSESGKNKEVEEKTHKVLILDPACGTGTFLYHVVDMIRKNFMLKNQAGMWSGYVKDHLLPRIFGFELMMAPYAVAHLKLGMQLHARDLREAQRKDWAYDFKDSGRLGIYLTNTLVEIKHDPKQLDFALNIIKNESNAALEIKHDLPIMVVMGNPPYSGHSANKSWEMVPESFNEKRLPKKRKHYKKKEKLIKKPTFIGKLLQDYYEVDGKPLEEKNPKWLQDDYVKFIRFGQWRIKETGSGIMAFITNHGYLDNPTFRGMRQKLINAFTDIYILDLHGNKKKKERCPDGSEDMNVFDIQQGVAIGIFIKEPGKAGPAKVHHAELWGIRQSKDKKSGKYPYLSEKKINSTKWQELNPDKPFYLFIPQDIEKRTEYEKFFTIKDIFPLNGVGMTTARDHIVIEHSEEPLLNKAKTFRDSTASDEELCRILSISKKKGWNISNSRKIIKKESNLKKFIKPVLYRPFDKRLIFYHDSLVWRTVKKVMRHMLEGENIALVSARSNKSQEMNHFFCSKFPIETKCGESTTQSALFPLYLFNSRTEAEQIDHGLGKSTDLRRPNLNPDFIKELEVKLKLSFVSEGTGDLIKTFGPEDIFNYIYGVLHSPTYRKRYIQFLKIDFPRVPLTENLELFRELALRGGELVKLHLLEAPKLAQHEVGYPVTRHEEENLVEKGHPRYLPPGEPEPGTGKPLHKGRVFINTEHTENGLKSQYFEGVPQEVWEFQVGGYQVCEKWLKDRRGRNLTYEEQETYCKIVAALGKTIRLMEEIDKIIDSHGGWPIK